MIFTTTFLPRSPALVESSRSALEIMKDGSPASQ
jgi:hypothetical protein